MSVLTKRVDRIEEAMITLIDLHQKSEKNIQQLHDDMILFRETVQAEIEALKEEFREFKEDMLQFRESIQAEVDAFKEEMKEFKDEMLAFKEEMRDFKDEMQAFKEEMKVFKDEMDAFKERMEREVKRINKQWGELSNKLGTIVEDIVYPGTAPVLKKYFKCDPDEMMSNITRKRGNLRDEFDIIATCGNRVFLIEVKSTLRREYIGEAEEKVERFKKLFPEHRDKEVILIIATLKVTKSVAREVTRRCIYLMVYREWEYMDIVNFEECSKCQRM